LAVVNRSLLLSEIGKRRESEAAFWAKRIFKGIILITAVIQITKNAINCCFKKISLD
jgi:hypothetical protein